MKKSFILIVLMLLTSGCTLYSIDSESISEEFYPSKASANDVQYLEYISQPNEVIATVTVNAERRKQQTIDEVVEKMKREAAILGGDAITDIKTDASGTWKKLPAQKLIGNGFVRANFSASVVVFK